MRLYLHWHFKLRIFAIHENSDFRISSNISNIVEWLYTPWMKLAIAQSDCGKQCYCLMPYNFLILATNSMLARSYPLLVGVWTREPCDWLAKGSGDNLIGLPQTSWSKCVGPDIIRKENSACRFWSEERNEYDSIYIYKDERASCFGKKNCRFLLLA